MKRKYKAIAGILSISLLCCACAADNTDKKVTKPKSDYKEAEYQGQLDALRPSAYGDISGLNLEPGTYLSVIGKGTDSDYWKAVKRGAEQAVEDLNDRLGYKGNDKIKVVYSGCTEDEDVEEQVNILDEEMARYPAALAIAIIDENACSVQFDLAAENDLPIVVFDSGSDYQGIVSMISTDNKDAGKTAGNKLAGAIEEEGQVALFLADKKSMSSANREKGIKEAFEESYPGIEIVDIYHGDDLSERSKEMHRKENTPEEGTSAGEGAAPDADSQEGTSPVENGSGSTEPGKTDAQSTDPSQEGNDGQEPADDGSGQSDEDETDMTQQEMIEAILESHPDLKGCISGSEEMTEMLLDAAEKLELDDLKIVGFDTGKKQMKALEDDKLEGLVVQNPFGMGYAAVVAGARAVLGQANEAAVDSGYTWVTKDNMDKASIQKMLY